MRKSAFLVFLIVVAFCSVLSSADSDSKDKSSKDKKDKGPRLVLSAYPRQGFMPLHISFNAILENVPENDVEYYCLHEEWDFGDGAVSAEQPNCEPFTSESKINIHFFSEHTFSDEGDYTIRFTLGDPVKIRSNQTSVVVLDRELGH